MLDKVSPSGIYFHFQSHSLPLKNRKRLCIFIGSVFKKEKTLFKSAHFIFCSDDYLLNINQQFLKHNYYTDIITFNLAARAAPVEAEIYISLDRVRENARNHHQYYYKELHRVIFHGILHLCGYKDKSEKDIITMRSKEDYYMKQYL